MNSSCVAIGTYDGLHKGHQGLIAKVLEISKKKKLKSIVIALSKPVRHVSGILTELKEKKDLISQFPVDDIFILPVTDELVKITAKDFFEKYLIDKLNVKHLVIGRNFAFGHGRQGNVKWLRKNCLKNKINLTVKSFSCSHGKAISSSRIRTLLHQGRIEHAGKLLGRIYSFEGVPLKGMGIGKKIGIPTINLKVNKGKLLPLGVFLAVVRAKGAFFPAVLNIGSRPTFFNKGEVVPEINLIGFKGKWGKTKLKVFFLKHLRNERKFRNINELKKQLDKDLKAARRFFSFTF
ncbi:MAG: riboflavin biosynthesis protein RibF [Elusimicrobia bacterium]|nr:riboflavin biosynthesis protein RibF [Elusimicrobiota bacterium]